MADNLDVTPGSGATIATDDIGGVHFPISKVAFGAEGAATSVDPANPLPVGGAFVKAEDSPGADGDVGVVILAQRRDSDSAATSTDGDYATLKMDEAGRLKVATQPGAIAATTANITANAQAIFVNVERASNITISMVATSLVGHNISFEYSNNSTNGTDGNWYAVQVVRSNANTVETASGVLAATPVYGWEASVNAYKWLRVRATAHTSGTAAYTLLPGSYATEPIPAVQVTGTQPVSFTQPALVAGTAAIGDVGIQYRANATGAATIRHVVSAASTNATNAKAAAGRVVGWSFVNTTASWQYVKLHNSATAPTAGAGVVMTIGIPPNGSNNMPAGGGGIGFATGIGFTIVTGSADADATATTAGSVVGDLFFA
jgi:hypothetical protein